MRRFPLPGALALAAVLAGCAGRPGGTAPPAADASVNTGLESLTRDPGLKVTSTLDPSKGPLSDDEKAQLVRQAVADLEAYHSRNPAADVPSLAALTGATDVGAILGGPAPGAPMNEPPPAAAPVEPSAEVLSQAQDAWNQVPTPAGTGAPPAAPAANPVFVQPSPDDPLLDLASRMARLLREPVPAGGGALAVSLGGAGGERIADAVALAAIESLRPGVLADLESDSNLLGPRLAEPDRRALIDARDRLLKNPDQASQALVRSLSHIAPAARLRIARAELCRRVEGFGRYEPLGTDTFVAGRPIRMIVYTELDGFAARPARQGDPIQPGAPLAEQVSVELAQTLTLYHDPSGLQAWHLPAQKVVETARAKRRDFYLIHQIELPATLTVGKYSLKVSVTDKTSGVTDEINLPVNVVAAIRGSR
jgi:hypothetical protein